jgi:hypothetical protein
VRKNSYKILVENEGTDHLEDLGVDRKIILKLRLQIHDKGVDYIQLADYKFLCRVLVKTIMDNRVP